MGQDSRPRLRTGCRRGEKAALDALLYGTADGLYAMSLAAMADEHQAQDCLRETWRRLLAELGGLRFPRNPRERLWRIAERVAAERVGGARVRDARRSVQGPDGTPGLDGVQAPEELLEELSALSDRQAPLLQAHWYGRRRLFRIGIAALFVLAVGVWTAVFYQRMYTSHDLAELQYRCLRERIVQQDLAAAVRVAAEQLEAPSDADREAASNCERIILVFEEIANNEHLDSVGRLRYIKQRVVRDQLADFVRSLPRDSRELQKSLPRVALALEEVENL
ncbi:MAG: hypothetical protein J7M38_06360 [Armatimonadetes bacterium]|nr:hypothetical protein [Armatimonadota bacterium]